MTPTKFYCLLYTFVVLLYSGCSSTSSQQVANEPDPAPLMVAGPESTPEVVPEPEPEVEEVVAPEPASPVVETPVIVAPPEPEVSEPDTITILGFIKYVELEGGFFGIMTEDGTKYFPEYLEQGFKQDGLGVRVQAKPQEQILGIQMWGNPIEIIKIEAN
ncbi:hypothetical protein F7C95_20795 [Opitutia bacterium ISCC 51]|nr:hypothetical protein F7C95_20795 [Opitutae bacterium ISCC 51]QXD28383.1 hypothetical protein GA003_20700 [Opitutae bacterium ISCC 52]